MAMESARFEDFPAPKRIADAAAYLQASLALIAFEKKHPEAGGVDPLHPRQNDRGVQRDAGMEWASEHAARFRAYVEEHPDETVAVDDRRSIELLYERIAGTVH